MKHVLSLSTLYPNEANPRFGTFVARSIEALAARGDWRVTMVNPIGIPPVALGRYRALARLPAMAVEHGVTVHRPRFTLIPKFGARRNAKAIARAALPLVKQIHADTPIDVIDAQFFYPDGPASAWIAQQLGLPCSIKARGADICYWGDKDYAREEMLEAANCCSGLLAVSQELAGQMAEMGMRRDHITLHYTGLDRGRFRPLDSPGLRAKLARELGFDLPDGAPLLVTVGALIERKGQDIALGSLAALPQARLILVGKGEDEAHLRRLAKDLGIADRVHFAGSVDHEVLPEILSAADVMALPTRSEGLANAWVEALACGTPVVTCDVGGASELITSNAAGRLVPRDIDHFAAAISEVLADKPDPKEVAATVDRFSWSNNAAELAQHYERLIG
ncbi:glycosyltransferase [Altererythrobacter sp.]|uniref:glycosyltransferase n=1 Tax=Altererythrobacter sp. TaxID=1872480 RepID=UPI003D11543F